MTKIVINTCFGGFSLSAAAVKRMAELNGKPCFFFKIEYMDGESVYVPCEMDKLSHFMWFAFTTKDLPPKPSHEEWSKKCAEYSRKMSEISLDNRNVERDDPILVRVVEELGDKANGSCAELKVVEIPDDVKWQIDEYDGSESISEVHRSWS